MVTLFATTSVLLGSNLLYALNSSSNEMGWRPSESGADLLVTLEKLSVKLIRMELKYHTCFFIYVVLFGS